MRRRYVAFSALALVGLGVTGCAFRFEQREAWRAQAEEACLAQKLVRPSAYMSRMSAIDGPGTCGMSYPFKVAALADGAVALSQRATLACPVISRSDAWLTEVVQPAAAMYFGSSVVEVKSGSYSCRPRNSQRGARMSEHSFGNALDVMAFRLADGREVTVVRGWRGAPEEQEFLREVFVGACDYFSTVLGPGSDAFHYDHFHLDLARHDARGTRRVCKPALSFTPRLGTEAAPAPRPQAPPGGWQPAEQPPIDIDEDSDPFAVDGPPQRTSSPAAVARAPQTFTASQSVPAATSYPPQATRPGLYGVPLPPPGASAARIEPSAPREPVVLQPQLRTGRTIY
jgi:hypothetical protein